MKEYRMLAADYGASSGRVVLGSWDGIRLITKEVHRFANEPVRACGVLYWDVLRLYHELCQGMIKAGEFDSISVDTWGVDFGLIGSDGKMMGNPVHYRDDRTAGMMDRVHSLIHPEKLYEITGNQLMEINTIYQLMSLQQQNPETLNLASHMLMMPDLFTYLLSGEVASEYSAASTSQLLDIRKRQWSGEIIRALGLKESLFPKLVESGTRIGKLTAELQNVVGLPGAWVVSGAGHDTQSAMIAVPAQEEDFIFISSGTWSLFGTEQKNPITSQTAFRKNMTNECAAERKVSFHKNITGLWLLQESRRQWKREGRDYSYSELEGLALQSQGGFSVIDVDDPVFAMQGDIPRRIREYCKKTSQYVPDTVGGVVSCIYNSLALKYRRTKEDLEECTGKTYERLYMIGGGVKDAMLCQITADACGVPVIAGSSEATALGNLVMQLIAAGEIQSIRTAREIISKSYGVREYIPQNSEKWQDK